nr:hypothetical protein [Streptomyces sp. ERV7]
MVVLGLRVRSTHGACQRLGVLEEQVDGALLAEFDGVGGPYEGGAVDAAGSQWEGAQHRSGVGDAVVAPCVQAVPPARS